MSPKSVRITEEGRLSIAWDDGETCEYILRDLRRNCPCATCLADAQSRSASFIPLYTRDALTIASIQPVGRYALQFTWKDGHSTGIYTYDALRALCPRSNEDAP
jgi:DUF971 family protein